MNSISEIIGKELIYQNKKIIIKENSLIIDREKMDVFPKLIPQRISLDRGGPVIIFKQK